LAWTPLSGWMPPAPQRSVLDKAHRAFVGTLAAGSVVGVVYLFASGASSLSRFMEFKRLSEIEQQERVEYERQNNPHADLSRFPTSKE